MEVEPFCQELRQVGELLCEQATAGLNRAETLDSLFEGKKTSLESFVGASASDKDMIVGAIRGGPWDTRQVVELVNTLDGKGCKRPRKGGLGGDALTTQRRKNQDAPQFENFIDEKLWIDLRSPTKFSPASRCHMLARSAAKLGICNPSQNLLYRLVQMLAYSANDYDMSQADVFANMDKIQDFIKGYKQDDATPYLIMYPRSVDELDARLRE